MIKQTITYKDYNGGEQTEDFYFHLDQEEMLSMELNHEGGLSAYIEQLNQTTAGADAYNLFKKIILAAYGKKSADGKFFWKRDPDNGRSYADEFVASPAMSELIFSFLKDSNDAASFVKGLLPEHMIAEAERDATKARAAGSDELVAVAPSPVTPIESKEKKPEDYTREELVNMPIDEFNKLVGTDPTKMHPSVLQVAFQRKAQS